MGKDVKKTHSKFYRDHINVSWFEIGRTNFESAVHGGLGVIFSYIWKIPKITYGEGREDA